MIFCNTFILFSQYKNNQLLSTIGLNYSNNSYGINYINNREFRYSSSYTIGASYISILNKTNWFVKFGLQIGSTNYTRLNYNNCNNCNPKLVGMFLDIPCQTGILISKNDKLLLNTSLGVAWGNPIKQQYYNDNINLPYFNSGILSAISETNTLIRIRRNFYIEFGVVLRYFYTPIDLFNNKSSPNPISFKIGLVNTKWLKTK